MRYEYGGKTDAFTFGECLTSTQVLNSSDIYSPDLQAYNSPAKSKKIKIQPIELEEPEADKQDIADFLEADMDDAIRGSINDVLPQMIAPMTTRK